LGGGYLMGTGLILMFAMTSAFSVIGMFMVEHLGQVGAIVGGFLLAGAIFYLLWILLMVAMWFAPALVMLDNTPPLDAMILSLRACGRNLSAVALMSLALYVLTSLAMLPAGLGVLVLMPVVAGAAYASWQDVFPQEFARLVQPQDSHDAS
jgi:uncharacterized membrane protein